MDKLPPELLHRIFFLLDFQTKLVCLTICRSWWRVLDKYRLFFRVDIKTNNLDRLHEMMDMFKRLPECATKVVDLDIVLETYTLFNRRVLFNIFPNVRIISTLPQQIAGFYRPKPYEGPIDVLHSNARIECLYDFYHCELVSQLVYSNLGQRLKTLHLNFTTEVRPSTNFKLSRLKNLPVLNKLTLQLAKIKIQDLEELHKNVASIQDLTLENVVISEGSEMPLEITPATLITKLKYSYGSIQFETRHAQIYQYMAKKYTRLTDVDYKSGGLRGPSLDQSTYIYMNGLLDFLRVIGPLQSQLTLWDLADGIDPFEALDSVNSRLKQLCVSTCQGGTLFEYLAQSNQCKHLEGLRISNTSINSIDPIKNLTNLTLLSISSFGSDNNTPAVDLKRCLDVCPPSLKTLHIYSYKLEVVRFNNRLYSIEMLDIGHHKISSKLGHILSNCLPNLVKLRLAGEVVENVDVIIKNPQFQEAVFSTEPVIGNPDGEYGFAFSSPDKKKYYHCTDSKKMRVQLEAIKDLPILSVVFLTEKKLILKNGIKVFAC